MVRSPTPAPGPITIALSRLSPNTSPNSTTVSTACTMTAVIFVAAGLRHRKTFAPDLRGVLKSLRPDLREHVGVNADIGEAYPPAIDPPRQQQMRRLFAEEGDGLGR